MALTNNQMEMIKYISKNDLSMAKKAALACLAEDNSKKNESKVSYYTRILQSSSLSMVQLPVDIAGFADLEDLSSYNEKRYYITSREIKLFEQVSKMHKVSLALMEKRIPYLNATLLYGESGVGKTAFSRYTAYKLGLPYLYINFSRLIESYLGKTSKNISHLFDFIKKNQCLVMFDEIDCIAASRRYGGGAESELARSTTTLIQLLDGISNDHVIFAATNLYDAIDPAVLRRFTIKHEMLRLSEEDKLNFIDQFFSDIEMKYDLESAKIYAKNDISQAVLMNHIVRSIADGIMAEADMVKL